MTIQEFRKTATIQAQRWDPKHPAVLDWMREFGAHFAVLDGDRLGIGTLESGDGLDRHAAKPGDWIARGPSGEFYAIDADVFSRTYEAVAS